MKPTQIFYRLLAIGFLLLSTTARAEGAYIIGALESSNQDVYEEGAEFSSGDTLTEVDEKNTTMLGFGKEFNNGWAIELFSATPFKADLTSSADETLNAKMTTIGLAMKWHLDFSDNSRGFVKAGYHSWEVEATVSSLGVTLGPSIDGTDLLWGLGTEYQFNHNLAMIIGYDDYTVGDANFGDTYVGLKFDF